MNKRISKKIYKRANQKLNQYIKLHKDKRTTLEVEQASGKTLAAFRITTGISVSGRRRD